MRPRYVKEHLTLNFEKFHGLIEESCIIKDLEYFLVNQFLKPEDIPRVNSFQPIHSAVMKENYVQLADKKRYYGYDLIFDKDLIRLK